MKKYTYKDWLDGKLILKYDYIIPKGETPILGEWNDFNADEDILLIKRKQKEIFDERVANLLEKYKSVFNKEIEASKEFEEHCRLTLNQIDSIFTGVLTPTEFIRTEYWNCVFLYKDLCEIQGYYKNTIIRGVEVDYAFINSPRMNYQRQGVNSQIYAHTLYLFRKWVETLQSQKIETKTNKPTAPVLGVFCSLINTLGIDKKNETESAIVYCERICVKFKLPYTDRVRQNYNVNETKKLMQALTEKVLPLIDNETKILVQKYLDSKLPSKQNLYA